MIKSELVQKISEENPHLYQRDVERLVETIFNEITFEVWSAFSSALMFKTLTTLVIASIIIHSVIGLWTVGTDYLTPRTLGFISSSLGSYANHFRVMYQLLFVTLSVTLMLITSFLIWWS